MLWMKILIILVDLLNSKETRRLIYEKKTKSLLSYWFILDSLSFDRMLNAEKPKSESSSTSQKTTLQTKQSSEKSTDAKQTTEAHSESSQSSSHSNNEETLAPH